MTRNLFEKLKESVFSLKKCLARAGFAVFAGVFSVLVLGCSDSLEDNASNGEGLSVVISNFNSYSISEYSARTIAPDTYSSSDIKKYIVTGEDYAGNLCNQAIEISNGTGTITGLNKSFWNFTLHAYSDAAGTNEVLHGYASVDTTIETSVAFVLTSVALETKGSLDLTLTYADAASFVNVDQINIYLCDDVTCDVSSPAVMRILSSNLSDWTSTGYNLTADSISPGYYCLIIKFYSTSTGSAILLGTFSDIVDIEPGRETLDSVEISGILSTPPAAPHNLKVYRVDSSESYDSYKAVIRWDDESINEDYFVLNVYEASNSSTRLGALVASINKTNFTSFSFGTDGIGYAGGSVLYSSKEYVLKLQTGKLYEFEIYAVNSFGSSAVVSRAASTDIVSDSTYGTLTGFDASSTTPYLHVNTIAVTYEIGGGVYKTAADKYSIAANFIEYYIYKNSPIALIAPVAITDTSDMLNQVGYPVLYFNTPVQDWAEWQDDNGNTITQVSSFTNITAHAVYNLVSDDAIELDSSCVSATYGATVEGSYPGTGTNAFGAYNLTAGNYVTVAVNVDSAQNFDSFDFYVNGTKQTSVAASSTTAISAVNYVLYTFAIPFKGSYTVQVAGVKGGTSYYAEEIAFASNN